MASKANNPFAKFTNPAPSDILDREDDFGDAINMPDAGYINYAELEKTAKGVEKAPLRQATDRSSHISISHGKYAGKRGSRVLEETREDEEDEEEDEESGDEYHEDEEGKIWKDALEDDDDEDDDDDEEDGEEEDEEMGEREEIEDDMQNGASADESEEDEEALERDEEEEREDEEEDDEEDEERGLDGTTATSQKAEMTKAQHTKAQLQVWDDVMSIRMALQPELTAAIQFPQKEELENYKQDPEIKEELNEINSEISGVLDQLVKLQEELFVNSKAEVKIDKPNNNKRKREERTCDDWWNVIDSMNKGVTEYCGTVMDKWSGRMQVSSGKLSTKKFESFNQSFLAQVDSLFSDRDRLVKKTTQVRKGLKIYGKEAEREKMEFDDEIFDDSDFYQMLLKDLIANGSIGSSGNSQDYWKEMSKAKSAKGKQNKSYLRGASKGRIAKYDVQDKLMHFMAPDERPLKCDWNLNEFFSNLFGGVGKE